MKSLTLKFGTLLVLAVGAVLLNAPVMADKPEWAGAGKGGKSERGERRDEGRDERREGRDDRDGARRKHFDDRNRAVAHEYYESEFRNGRCPPGLAKKHNGCMPPGQARKWQYGRPLPKDVVYYELPREVVVRIGVPPAGYRYVRVAGDILMIAAGTSMVIDAIEDLRR